jgi:hypothetical protein
MTVAAQITGLKEAQVAMKKYEERMGGDPFVILGFGALYALAVHERTDVYHGVGEAKFLENAVNKAKKGYARDLARKADRLEKDGYKHPTAGALYQKALEIDADAVSRVPVDTGRLRASHFVAPPEGVAGTDAPTKGDT